MTITNPDEHMQITRPIRHYQNSRGKDELHVVRYSKSISDLLAGSHDISMLNNPERAQAVFALHELNKLKDSLGWMEHTSDWDWGVGFLLMDDTYVGDEMFDPHRDPDDDSDGPFCDDFKVKWDQNVPGLFTTNEAQIEALGNYTVHVEVCWHTPEMAADEYMNKVIPIKDIHTIYISER